MGCGVLRCRAAVRAGLAPALGPSVGPSAGPRGGPQPHELLTCSPAATRGLREGLRTRSCLISLMFSARGRAEVGGSARLALFTPRVSASSALRLLSFNALTVSAAAMGRPGGVSRSTQIHTKNRRGTAPSRRSAQKGRARCHYSKAERRPVGGGPQSDGPSLRELCAALACYGLIAPAGKQMEEGRSPRKRRRRRDGALKEAGVPGSPLPLARLCLSIPGTQLKGLEGGDLNHTDVEVAHRGGGRAVLCVLSYPSLRKPTKPKVNAKGNVLPMQVQTASRRLARSLLVARK